MAASVKHAGGPCESGPLRHGPHQLLGMVQDLGAFRAVPFPGLPAGLPEVVFQQDFDVVIRHVRDAVRELLDPLVTLWRGPG